MAAARSFAELLGNGIGACGRSVLPRVTIPDDVKSPANRQFEQGQANGANGEPVRRSARLSALKVASWSRRGRVRRARGSCGGLTGPSRSASSSARFPAGPGRRRLSRRRRAGSEAGRPRPAAGRGRSGRRARGAPGRRRPAGGSIGRDPRHGRSSRRTRHGLPMPAPEGGRVVDRVVSPQRGQCDRRRRPPAARFRADQDGIGIGDVPAASTAPASRSRGGRTGPRHADR